MKTRALAFIGIFLTATAFAHAQDTTVEAVAGLVESSVEKLGGNTVAVFPFPYADGIKSIEGALMSERILTRLSEGGVVRVVERAILDKVMAEQKLSASGFIEPASSIRIGRLLGARGILSGSVTDLGENIEIHVRLANVESGETVGTLKAAARKTIKTFISPLWTQIEKLKKEGGSFSVKAWTDKSQEATTIPSYRIGDFLTLNFEVDRDCYLTIFDFTTSGSIHVLFPNSFTPDNTIKAGRTYTFPDAQAGFKIRVQDPPGLEQLKFFATMKKVNLFEEDYSTEKFRSLNSDNYSVTRDLETVITSLDSNAWAEFSLEIRIEQILRNGGK
jgi:TolB-like protein